LLAASQSLGFSLLEILKLFADFAIPGHQANQLLYDRARSVSGTAEKADAILNALRDTCRLSFTAIGGAACYTGYKIANSVYNWLWPRKTPSLTEADGNVVVPSEPSADLPDPPADLPKPSADSPVEPSAELIQFRESLARFELSPELVEAFMASEAHLAPLPLPADLADLALSPEPPAEPIPLIKSPVPFEPSPGIVSAVISSKAQPMLPPLPPLQPVPSVDLLLPPPPSVPPFARPPEPFVDLLAEPPFALPSVPFVDLLAELPFALPSVPFVDLFQRQGKSELFTEPDSPADLLLPPPPSLFTEPSKPSVSPVGIFQRPLTEPGHGEPEQVAEPDSPAEPEHGEPALEPDLPAELPPAEPEHEPARQATQETAAHARRDDQDRHSSGSLPSLYSDDEAAEDEACFSSDESDDGALSDESEEEAFVINLETIKSAVTNGVTTVRKKLRSLMPHSDKKHYSSDDEPHGPLVSSSSDSGVLVPRKWGGFSDSSSDDSSGV
jgi:hypothetical protein